MMSDGRTRFPLCVVVVWVDLLWLFNLISTAERLSFYFTSVLPLSWGTTPLGNNHSPSYPIQVGCVWCAGVFLGHDLLLSPLFFSIATTFQHKGTTTKNTDQLVRDPTRQHNPPNGKERKCDKEGLGPMGWDTTHITEHD